MTADDADYADGSAEAGAGQVKDKRGSCNHLDSGLIDGPRRQVKAEV